jgi:RHS repeat-associated protein
VGNHYEVSGSTVTKYYFAGSTRIAMRTGSTLYYLLSDHLGSTSVTTNASGGLVAEMRYKPWGETRLTSGTTPTAYTFQGQYSNVADFGLQYFNARWYDGSLGRWAQPDSVVPSGVQGYDRYAFVDNNPLRYTDPSGHEKVCIGYTSQGCSTWYETETSTAPPPPLPVPNPIQTSLTAILQDGVDSQKLWADSWGEFKCGSPNTGYADSCLGQYLKYFTLTGGTTIPNPYTGTVVGWHGAISIDQNGHWYFGLGLDAGKNVLGWDLSLVEGRFAKDQLPENDAAEEKFLQDFLTGNSVQGYLVPILYLGGNYSFSVGRTSFDLGLGSPQGGLAWTYTWRINR